MSAVDDMIAGFCDKLASLRWSIEDAERWMKNYESWRQYFPVWETKDGQQMKVSEIDDTHLDNLIPFIEKRDPKNVTNWVDVFKAEKRYRELKKLMPSKKAELHEMEEAADRCL